MLYRSTIGYLVYGISLLLWVTETRAQTPTSPERESTAHFSGKTINLIVGLSAGGGYDTYARFFARHYPKHLPGRPQVVVQNMPGAGGLRAATYLYSVAPKDGTTIATFGPSVILEPLLGNPQASFDPAKFNWIGNLNKDVLSCGVWRTSGLSTFRDVEARGGIFGGTGPLTLTTQHALLLKNLLELKVKVVQGFGGTNEVNLAMQRGEVDGTCGMFLSTIRGPYSQHVRSGDLKLIVQFTRHKEKDFGHAESIYDLVKREDDKIVLDFLLMPIDISRPLVAPPDIPVVIMEVLRRGFNSAVLDPDLIAESKKIGIEVNYQTSSEVSMAFGKILETPPHLIDRAKELISKQ